MKSFSVGAFCVATARGKALEVMGNMVLPAQIQLYENDIAQGSYQATAAVRVSKHDRQKRRQRT